jgi:hypothetical protein
MSMLALGATCVLIDGTLSTACMPAHNLSDKTAAPAGAFVNPFAIGFHRYHRIAHAGMGQGLFSGLIVEPAGRN